MTKFAVKLKESELNELSLLGFKEEMSGGKYLYLIDGKKTFGNHFSFLKLVYKDVHKKGVKFYLDTNDSFMSFNSFKDIVQYLKI